MYLMGFFGLSVVFSVLILGGDFPMFWRGGKSGAISLKHVALVAPCFVVLLDILGTKFSKG